MPNCFSLTRKAAPEAGFVRFDIIDNELCAAFGVVPDEVQYYLGWYDSIGLMLAIGKSFADMRVIWAGDTEILKVVDWLDEHFTSDAWYWHGYGG